MKAPPEMRRAPGKAPLKNQLQTTTEANPTLLAEKINAEVDLADEAAMLAQGTAQRALDHARLAGEYLIQAKSAFGHGKWQGWLADNCPRLHERRAQRLMRFARNPTLLSDSVTGALKLLTKPKPIDWEVRIGEAADVAPLLDAAGHFFTVTKADKLIMVEHSDQHVGYYVIHRCDVVRDAEGEICGVAEEEDVLRPLKADAVGFFLEEFGCTRSDTWLRSPREVRAAA